MRLDSLQIAPRDRWLLVQHVDLRQYPVLEHRVGRRDEREHRVSRALKTVLNTIHNGKRAFEGAYHNLTLGSCIVIELCVSIRVKPTIATLRSFGWSFGACGMTKLMQSCDHRLEHMTVS